MAVPKAIAKQDRRSFHIRMMDALEEVFEERGPDCLRDMAIETPNEFLKLAYSTLPKDILVKVTQQSMPGDLDPEEWRLMVQVLRLIKENIPAGVQASASEVFGLLATTLRSHYAKELVDRTAELG